MALAALKNASRRGSARSGISSAMLAYPLAGYLAGGQTEIKDRRLARMKHAKAAVASASSAAFPQPTARNYFPPEEDALRCS